ncbi:hypothetical protein K6W76_30450 [Burkholderia anthina]|uniref:hypothetical protein n=1 Tax=Burkholderia anthina TaxID=179879 RepID=UPI00158A103B|nr:hypothetical protein [Burkholderia anthina]MBY4870766.1 hypothetical protein [Burkholderia anthina]
MAGEFEEIAHSGGKVTIHIIDDENGRRGYQMSYQSMRPVPMALTGVYALGQSGMPVATYNIAGPDSAPFPGCVPVMVASDSEGKFGHHCPACDGYWRSGPWANVCPYCAVQAQPYEFLSHAQFRYVRHYCEVFAEAINADEPGEVTIDMDVVADAVQSAGEKPAFYVSEQSQQHKFKCTACDEFNDILGRFGFCALCGTRNDLMEFEGRIVLAMRDRLNAGAPPSDCVRDGVAALDTFIAQYAKALAMLVPMIERRQKRLTGGRFHDLVEVRDVFSKFFGVDICAGMPADEIEFATRMFHRRHVYEHNGGEVDQRYLDESGDKTVRLKQHIQETQQDGHRLTNSLVKMARNLHKGFHEIIPPLPKPIEAHEARKARIADRSPPRRARPAAG